MPGVNARQAAATQRLLDPGNAAGDGDGEVGLQAQEPASSSVPHTDMTYGWQGLTQRDAAAGQE
jgi:hypothetical protein